ncbi:MAG: glycosyltransferase family 4 protein [Lewinellaceae bacterium]|nr:glycosyltransferase family 4 protein [Lewinellaceae bacterium]
MNIALLTTYPHGGAGVACRRLQAALNDVGVQAELLTRNDASAKWPFYAERLSFLPCERDRSVRFSFSPANFGTDISKHPVVRKADVLHLHWINQGFLSLKNLGQLADLGKPIVWTLHDMWAFTGGCHYSGTCEQYLRECGHCPFLRRPGASDLSHRIWLRKKKEFPANLHFVTCSAWLAERARTSGLLRRYSVQSIPNPIDTTVFAPASAEKRLAFRRQLGINDASLVVLFVAMKVQDERKGFRYLQQALVELKAQQPDRQIDLLILGHSRPEDLAALPYPCHPLGMVQDAEKLALAYGASDVFVIPSLEDNLPNTVMEALSCGTPVVGFQTGGIPEMVDHLRNGFVVPQRDSGALTEGIRWIYEKEAAAMETLRAAARTKVETHYAGRVVAEQHLALYQKVLS